MRFKTTTFKGIILLIGAMIFSVIGFTGCLKHVDIQQERQLNLQYEKSFDIVQELEEKKAKAKTLEEKLKINNLLNSAIATTIKVKSLRDEKRESNKEKKKSEDFWWKFGAAVIGVGTTIGGALGAPYIKSLNAPYRAAQAAHEQSVQEGAGYLDAGKTLVATFSDEIDKLKPEERPEFINNLKEKQKQLSPNAQKQISNWVTEHKDPTKKG